MTRFRHICWRAQDRVLAWRERLRVHRVQCRITRDPQEVAYDAAWDQQDTAQGAMARADSLGRIICYAVAAFAAGLMVGGGLIR